MKRSIFILTIGILSIFSCVRKRDFDFDKIKWDDITPSWGLPLINTQMSIADAIDKTKSSVILEIDNNGFITLIYLDTIVSPTGEALFDNFGFPRKFVFNPKAGFGTAIIPPNAPVGTKVTLPNMSGLVPFEMDSLQNVVEINLKGGLLNITTSSDYRHDIRFRLTLPDLKNQNGVSFSTIMVVQYVKGFLPTIKALDPKDMSLAGYKLSSATGQKNKVAYTISEIELTVRSDNPPVANPIFPTDSIRFDISLSELNYKYVIGKFKPLHIKSGLLRGSTDIAAFKNSVDADIRFADPSVGFDFQNSFGIIPSILIDTAEMQFANQKTPVKLKTNSTANMNIPGSTSIKPGIKPGEFLSTPVTLNKNTSNIDQILVGAPNKFIYSISSITLSSPSSEDAFISDDSQIKIYTQVKLPFFGAIKYLILSDSIKNVEMIKPQNIDYIEFKIGSENSIPLAVDLQAYFLDTVQKVVDSNGKVTFKVLDSLITPPISKAIVTAADFDPNNLANTSRTTLDRIIPISKEKYYNISFCNMIVIKGTLMTPEAQTNNVRFSTKQSFTYKLSAFAKLRINPARTNEDDLINKSK